jgi:hypothetical protein
MIKFLLKEAQDTESSLLAAIEKKYCTNGQKWMISLQESALKTRPA